MLDVLGSIAAILAGGGTGLIGTLASFGIDFLQREQAHKQEVEMRRIDLEIAEKEAAGAARVAELKLEGDVAQAESTALAASYRQEMTRFARRGEGGVMLAVDVVRGLMRPGLTLYFVLLSGLIYFNVGADDAGIRQAIIETVLFLTTTTVIWWFGGRQVAKRQPGAA